MMIEKGCTVRGAGRARLRAATALPLALAALLPASAWADPLSVTATTTGPVTTAQASNGTPGDVTVASGGTITDANAEPVVTVNSSNNITNNGIITSTAATGATGMLVTGATPITTTINNAGTISVTGSGGSGNYGLRIANGPVSGSISSSSASTIAVAGDNSYGVAINSAFTGPVALNGVSVTGVNSAAVAITAALNGALTLTGTLSGAGVGSMGVAVLGSVSGALDNGATISGGILAGAANPLGTPAALLVGASVAGGVVNDRYFLDTTGARLAAGASTTGATLVTGAITDAGGASAVIIQPQASAPGNIELGRYGATGSGDEYGFVNRGAISASDATPGIAVTTMLVSGATLNGTAYTTTLDGGLNNQSTGAITASASDAASTALAIGSGGSAATILNAGTITATVTTAYTGGTAQAVLVQAGASVPSLTNSGSIGASGTTGAYAIRDLSGGLLTITNSGAIAATSASGVVARAIDLSAGTGAQLITNSGTITGDVAFGTGAGTLAETGGSLTGAVAFGAGANVLRLSGASTHVGALTVASGGSLALSLADTSSIHVAGTVPTLSSLSAGGSSTILLDVASLNTPLISVTGAATFTGTSQIKLNFTQPVTSGTLVIINAAGGITSDHGAPISSVTGVPFIFQLGTPTITGGVLSASLSEKTPAQLGFGPGFAPLVTASYAALGKSDALFQAFVNLPDQPSVQAVYNRLTPPTYGSAVIRLAQNVQGATDDAIDNRFATLRATTDTPGATGANGSGRVGLWLQQAIAFPNQRSGVDDPGYADFGYTIAGGADYALTRNLYVGVGLSESYNNLTPDLAKTQGDGLLTTSTVGDLYVLWHKGAFFADAIGSVGHDSYKWTRAFAIDTISDTLAAHWSATQYAGSATVGVHLTSGRWFFEPSDQVSIGTLHEGAYAITGTGDLDLDVAAQHDKLSTNAARLSLGYSIGRGDGRLLLALRGGYLSQLDRYSPSLTASFVTTGTPFTITSPALASGEAEFGASATLESGGFAIRLAADRQQVADGYSDTSASVTLRLRL